MVLCCATTSTEWLGFASIGATIFLQVRDLPVQCSLGLGHLFLQLTLGLVSKCLFTLGVEALLFLLGKICSLLLGNFVSPGLLQGAFLLRLFRLLQMSQKVTFQPPQA